MTVGTRDKAGPLPPPPTPRCDVVVRGSIAGPYGQTFSFSYQNMPVASAIQLAVADARRAYGDENAIVNIEHTYVSN